MKAIIKKDIREQGLSISVLDMQGNEIYLDSDETFECEEDTFLAEVYLLTNLKGATYRANGIDLDFITE